MRSFAGSLADVVLAHTILVPPRTPMTSISIRKGKDG